MTAISPWVCVFATFKLCGRYYSSVGDLAKARQELRPAVEIGINLLSDWTMDNDYQGYRKLGDASMDVRDDKNAIAAWCMIQPTEGLPTALPSRGTSPIPSVDSGFVSEDAANAVKGGPTEPASESLAPGGDSSTATNDPRSFQPSLLRHTSTSQNVKEMKGTIGYACDGDCDVSWTYADDMNTCRECIEVQFCRPCLAKLRQGTLHNVCDPTHDFLYIPPWDAQGMTRLQQGKILVGDQVLDLRVWLEGIKREWEIE